MSLLTGRPGGAPPRGGAAARRRSPGPVRVVVTVGWVLLGAVLIAFWPRPLGGETTVVRVAGESMVPTYATGDLLVARAHDGYQVGDVIIFDVPGGGPGAGMRVVHRIVGTVPSDYGMIYTTRGDARNDDDQWQIHDQDVLGRITLHLPHSGEVVTSVTDPKVVAVVAGVLVTLLLWPRGRRREEDPECSDDCPDGCPGTDAAPPRATAPAAAAPAPALPTAPVAPAAPVAAAADEDASHDGSFDYSARATDAPPAAAPPAAGRSR